MYTLPIEGDAAPIYPFYHIVLDFETHSHPFFCRFSVVQVLSAAQKLALHQINIRQDERLIFDLGGDLSDLSLVLERGGVLAIQQLPWDAHCVFSSTRMITTHHQPLVTNSYFHCKTPIFDNAGGSLKAKSVCVQADLMDNQKGLIQASHQADFHIKTLLDNTEGSILAGHQISGVCKGALHNRSGRILALGVDAICSLKSEGSMRNEHGGWIGGQSKTQLIAPTFKSDESSYLGYASSFRQGVAALSGTIDLAMENMSVEAPLMANHIRMKAKNLRLFYDLRTVKGTIYLESTSLFQAAGTTLGSQSAQSTIDIHCQDIHAQGHFGPKGRFKIQGLQTWFFAPAIFQQDIDLDLRLLIHNDIDFPYPMDLKAFNLEVGQAAFDAKCYRVHFKAPLLSEQKMAIHAPKSHLKIGDIAYQDFIQMRTKTGSLTVEGRSIDMPFAALYGAGPVCVQAQGPIIMGSLEHPTQGSHLRSDTQIRVETQDQLCTYHLNLDVQGDFHLKAPNNWYDVGGRTFIGGTAFLDTPFNEHRIKTKTITYPDDRMANVLNPHGVRNGTTTAVLMDASPPVFIANRVACSGETKMIGGPLYAASFAGKPPITEAFVESYHNYSETLYGHRKAHKASWYGGVDDWEGQSALSSFGTHTTTFERATIHLPGVVRAARLKLLAFTECLIGSFNHQSLQPLRPFETCIDLLQVARPNTALVEGVEDAPTLFIDRLSLNPSMPSLPRVIASPQGLSLQTAAKPLYPWSEEKKLIAIAFLRMIAQLPPDDALATFDLDALGHWLMENTLAWMQGLSVEDQVDALALMQQNPLRQPPKPILVYTAFDYENQAGLMVQGLKPMLIVPKSYEKLSVQAGGHLVAQQLWMRGSDHARLEVTHKVEGVKLLAIDVDTIRLETVPLVWQETLEQIQSTRHFLRKKTQRTVQTVQCSQVQTVATLATEGQLILKTKRLTQVGAVIKGGSKTSQLNIGSHTALPIYERSVQGYSVTKRSRFSKAFVAGSLHSTRVLPSRLVSDSVLNAQIVEGHYQALSVEARHKIGMVFKDLKLYPCVISQALAPQIDAQRGNLMLQQGTVQSATPTTFRVAQGHLFLASKGTYHSVASHYEAPRGITLKAKQFREEAQILDHTLLRYRFEVDGVSSVVSEEKTTHSTALLSRFITDQHARVVIETVEGAVLVAPQVQAETFRLSVAEGDAILRAVSLGLQRSVQTYGVDLELSTKPGIRLSVARIQEQATTVLGPDLNVNAILIHAGQNMMLEGIRSEAKRMALKASNTITISGVSVYRSYTQQSLSVSVGFDCREGLPYVGLDGSLDRLQTQGFVSSVCSHLDHLSIQTQTLHLKNGVLLQTKQAVLEVQHYVIDVGIAKQDQRTYRFSADSAFDLKADYHHVRHQSCVSTGIYDEAGCSLVQGQNPYSVEVPHHQDKHRSLDLPIGLMLAAFRRRPKESPRTSAANPRVSQNRTVPARNLTATQVVRVPQQALGVRAGAVFEPVQTTDLGSCITAPKASGLVQNSVGVLAVVPTDPHYFDALIAQRIAANRSHEGLFRQTYEHLNAFFEESHRLMDRAEQGAALLYRQYPALCQDAAAHTEGFAQFRRVVPTDAKDLVLKAAAFTGGPRALKGTVQGMHWLYGQAKVGYTLKTLDRRAEINHIFSRVNGQPKHGHLADTPANRRLIVETFSNKHYFRGVDSHGKAWFRRELPDQRECWVVTQGGRVKSGGVNEMAVEGLRSVSHGVSSSP
ncbi:MAG: hypothetical protein KA508_00745 [Gammaproteobacteria bacterium]|nr:hypothetical protein [Gammaproteobacteria bacterium]